MDAFSGAWLRGERRHLRIGNPVSTWPGSGLQQKPSSPGGRRARASVRWRGQHRPPIRIRIVKRTWSIQLLSCRGTGQMGCCGSRHGENIKSQLPVCSTVRVAARVPIHSTSHRNLPLEQAGRLSPHAPTPNARSPWARCRSISRQSRGWMCTRGERETWERVP